MKTKRTVLTFLSVLFGAVVSAFGVRFIQTERVNQAIKQGDLTEVDRLLTRGATLNGIGVNGMTPLMSACAAGDRSAVRHLVSLGADVNGCSKHRSALMLAVETGRVEIVRLLVQNNVNTDWTNFRGEDALSIASKRRFGAIVKLLDRSSNPGSKDQPER